MTQTIRSVVLSLGLVLSLAGCADTELAPNIVLIVADDLGWGDVGYNGSEIRTPEIDRLAAAGLTLDHFYAHPLCTPTRAALMTGRSPLTTGVLRPFEPWFEAGLALDEKLMPQYFREAGYQTFAVGKWHLGPNKKSYDPHNRGFDHFYGHLGGFLNHYLHTVWRGVDWQRNGATVHEEGHSTHLLTAEAVKLIRNRDADRPMFLYLSYSAPHTPLQAPPEAVAEYAAIEDEKRRTYAAMVTDMDRGIAEVTAALEDQELASNTLIVFMSDNGGRTQRGASNGPLRGEKSSGYEGGIRVPAFLHWPSHVPAGETFANRVIVDDLLPTLLSAAGISAEFPHQLDGRDLWPALAHGEPIEDKPLILARGGGPEFGFQFGYFSGDWKLVQTFDASTREPKLELFRIADDPFESNDLAGANPEIVQRLKRAVDAIPKADMIGIGAAPPPNLGGPAGYPGSVLPDDTPPTRVPYAEAEWTAAPMP